MLDRVVEIVRVRDKTKPGEGIELLNRGEYEEAAKRNPNLQILKTVKQPGSFLTLDATVAKELRRGRPIDR